MHLCIPEIDMKEWRLARQYTERYAGPMLEGDARLTDAGIFRLGSRDENCASRALPSSS